MPTYSYACKSCGHSFDAQQAFSEPSLTSCPQCQGNLRKLFSSVGVVFKGSGFYRTDSRGKAGSAAPAAAKVGDNKSSDPKSSDPKPSDSKASGGSPEKPSSVSTAKASGAASKAKEKSTAAA